VLDWLWQALQVAPCGSAACDCSIRSIQRHCRDRDDVVQCTNHDICRGGGAFFGCFAKFWANVSLPVATLSRAWCQGIAVQLQLPHGTAASHQGLGCLGGEDGRWSSATWHHHGISL